MTTALTITAARSSIAKMKPELLKVLPKHVTFDRFERVVSTALQRQPDLLKCTQKSLFEAITLCATDGLVPDGRQAAIVVFGDKAQYMPMTQGIIQRIQQSGELKSINALVVYEREVETGAFRYWIDSDGENLRHEPMLLSDPGKLVGVYAIAKTVNDGVYVEVMNMQEIEKIRSVSRSKNSDTWTKWKGEMMRKSAIRRLSKRLPMLPDDLQAMLERDDHLYEIEEVGERSTNDPIPSAKKSLSALGGKKQKPEPAAEDVQVIDVDVEDAEFEDDGAY